MLKRMGLFKRRRSNKPPTTEAKESDEQFAKVDVSMSSTGDSKDIISDRPAKSLEQSPSSRSSTDREIALAWGAFDGPAQSSVPSLASDRSAVRSPSPVPTIPLHYDVYALPEPTTSGQASSRHSCDSFDEPEPTLDTSTSFLLDATPPRTLRRYTESAVEPEAGLKSLFGKPAGLKSQPGSSPNDLFGPPLQDQANATPNITSHNPLVSEPIIHELPSDTVLQTSPVQAPFIKPLLTVTPPPVEPSAKPARRLDNETSKSMQDETSPSYKVALAQVFMYQARMTGQPTHRTNVTSAVTDDDIPFKSKTSGPRLSPVARAEARRPRSVSTSSIITPPNPSLSYDTTMVPWPLQVGSMVAELDGSESRSNTVDSEAWRRKSKMFQLDSFNNHARIVA
ncbi:hypothetical protein F4805DRAFT_458468 [Annulohypoxylon moriforme]|nr:hypothetical protein F4805DRAFT_458468 [Annulohypoxylon moriforme]